MNHKYCPFCGRPLDREAGVSVESLRAWCRERSYPVFVGDRVSESVAAELLNRSICTLRNWRSMGGPLRALRSGSGRGRVVYSLADIAEHLGREKVSRDLLKFP